MLKTALKGLKISQTNMMANPSEVSELSSAKQFHAWFEFKG